MACAINDAKTHALGRQMRASEASASQTCATVVPYQVPLAPLQALSGNLDQMLCGHGRGAHHGRALASQSPEIGGYLPCLDSDGSLNESGKRTDEREHRVEGHVCFEHLLVWV